MELDLNKFSKHRISILSKKREKFHDILNSSFIVRNSQQYEVLDNYLKVNKSSYPVAGKFMYYEEYYI